jgi:hypothetical protein
MGIMMPDFETEFNNKYLIVASCWFSLFILCSRCTVT